MGGSIWLFFFHLSDLLSCLLKMLPNIKLNIKHNLVVFYSVNTFNDVVKHENKVLSNYNLVDRWMPSSQERALNVTLETE